MTVLNTGSTKQYSANWEDIFAKGKTKKAAAGQPSAAGKASKAKAAGKAASSAKTSRGGKTRSAKKRK